MAIIILKTLFLGLMAFYALSAAVMVAKLKAKRMTLVAFIPLFIFFVLTSIAFGFVGFLI